MYLFRSEVGLERHARWSKGDCLSLDVHAHSDQFGWCGFVVDDTTCKFTSDAQLAFQHPYPPTKIMFMPDKEGAQPDLLATTGDYLRIWQLTEDGTQLVKLLNNVSPVQAPVTRMTQIINKHSLHCQLRVWSDRNYLTL